MLTLEEGAQRAVSCAGIRAHERVLVLYDDLTNAGPAWALRRAASSRGANAHVRLLGHPDQYGRPEVIDDVIDELVELDVVIAFTRSSVLGGEAAPAITAHGGRVFTITCASERTLTHGAIEADFAAVTPLCEFLAARLTEATQAKLSTAGGSELSMSLGEREGVASPPARPHAGVFRFPYAGAMVAPIETSVNGTMVVDLSTSLGRVDAPLTMVVEAGRVVAITGGAAATEVEQMLAASDKPSMSVLGVLGFGLNPAASDSGSLIEHVSLAGTGHFSLGSNRAIGGANHGDRHLEVAYAKPSLVLNGVQVLTDGELQSRLTVH